MLNAYSAKTPYVARRVLDQRQIRIGPKSYCFASLTGVALHQDIE
jgi:hypothetical protein